MPKVSVIVPVYGVEKYIEKCVRSLFEQTLDDIEFIFVDDCSPDSSIEILNSLIEEYRLRIEEKNYDVRILRMPSNSGQAAVRRKGMQLAAGDYVIHCDSDDWVERDMYEIMYSKAVSENADIVISDIYEHRGCEIINRVGTYSTDKDMILRDLLSCHMPLSVWNKLVDRRLFIENDIIFPEANKGEDMVLTIQLVYYSRKIARINKPLYTYFVRNSSMTHSVSKEAALARFDGSKRNTSLIISFLSDKKLAGNYAKELEVFKYCSKKNLLDLITERKYYKQWLAWYSEINFSIIFNSLLPIKERIRYLLFLLRIKR